MLGGFRLTAAKLFRRVAWLPAEAYATATTYLWDTLGYLNLWHYEADQMEQDYHAASPHRDHDLYPH